MKTIFKAKFENNEIEIINSWRKGEQLFVNGVLQDEQLNFVSSNLSGHIINFKGEKLMIKAQLSGFFTIGCRLFIDDQKVDIKKIA